MACPEQLKWINNHSYVEFEDYHRYLALEFLSLAFIFVSAVTLNFATIITILRVQSLREKLGNMLIINLCVMDLITSFGNMLFSLIDIFNEGYLICMNVLCWIHGGLSVIGCFGNFAAIIVIALHRFLAVVAKDNFVLTSKHIIIMITGCWVFALGVVIPLVMSTATMVYAHGNHHCSPYWGMACPQFFAFVLLMYATTLVTMISCYLAIYWKVRSSRKRLAGYGQKVKRNDETATSREQFSSTSEKGHDEGTNDPKRHHLRSDNSSQPDSGVSLTVANHQTTPNKELSEQLSVVEISETCQSGMSNIRAYKATEKLNRTPDIDIRIALTGILLVVTTIVCWTPFFVVNSCTRNKENSHEVTVSVMWLAYANSALDPIIYSVLNNKLRESILTQVRLLWSGLAGRKITST
ncbi:D(3) dopamine receptor [Holothuria leucospilota]|uniref:D(3) dopamine receptor n=1 Tax=Holothuria leucospilota TaxID=206669 RepID=A0A9Q1C7U2_HOLLE|nr:D(3) dopamine receptor [Holothuria leucospilota]